MLGFSALQLSRDAASADEWTLTELMNEGRLSLMPEEPGYAPPGATRPPACSATFTRAAGTVTTRTAPPGRHADGLASVRETVPEQTSVHRRVVGVALDYYRDTALTRRVVASAPEQSALIERMTVRAP